MKKDPSLVIKNKKRYQVGRRSEGWIKQFGTEEQKAELAKKKQNKESK